MECSCLTKVAASDLVGYPPTPLLIKVHYSLQARRLLNSLWAILAESANLNAGSCRDRNSSISICLLMQEQGSRVGDENKTSMLFSHVPGHVPIYGHL